MKKPVNSILISCALLGIFSLIGMGLVALTYQETEKTIAAKERECLLRSLHVLVPDYWFDNEIVEDTILVSDQSTFGTKKPVTVYRARKSLQPVALVIETTAPDGYNGSIKLLVAIKENGRLAGVRVISHKETPGLGDLIDAERSNWIQQFSGRSLRDPNEQKWAVKKDSGIFDQLTGATITPRAIINAVYKVLIYFRQNRQMLFSNGILLLDSD